jgi:chloramphenicol 3-O-phosphotransferase
MIILITGASHSGKTAMAQRLLEKYKYPYLSIDHLKMGLIRSGKTNLTPLSNDSELTEYLWPIVSEMIKTAIENRQNLIVEGVYIPSNWYEYFSKEYLENIKFYCIVLSEKYIKNNFEKIKSFANIIENRIEDDITVESVLEDNAQFLAECKKYGNPYFLIDEDYNIPLNFIN